MIASPFIGKEGSALVRAHASPGFRERGHLDLVTDLNPTHVADGSLEPEALDELLDLSDDATLWHVPRLHAKVLVADGCRAIVGSANLTAGGLFRNIEYGLDIADRALASRIERDIADIQMMGAIVAREVLARFSNIALEARRLLANRRVHLESAIQRLIREAEDQVMGARLADGPMHAVFARTVWYMLKRHGPMTTEQIHPMVQAIHPDLCDDTVDRVIAGRRFGKRWKHAVRTAQQQLKKQGLVELVNGMWRLRRNG